MVRITRSVESAERVFISYTRCDGAFALRLAGDLRAKGIPIWIDQVDIPSGTSWDEEVEKALRSARSILVVLSPEACTRSNVLDEISFALEHHKKVVPVLHRECEVPLRLVRHQHVDFTQAYEGALGELIGDLTGTVQAGENVSIGPNATSQSPAEVSRRLLGRRGLVLGGLLIIIILLGATRYFGIWKKSGRLDSQSASTVNSAIVTLAIEKPEAGLALLNDYVATRDSRTQSRFTGEAWQMAAQDFGEKAKQPSISTSDHEHWSAAEHFALGAAAESNGDAETARHEFDTSIQIQPQWALPHIGLAHVLTDLKDLNGALAQAQRAQVLDLKSWQAIAASAGVFVARSEFAKAIEEFRRALFASNDAPIVMSALAFAMHADGQHESEAERIATKTLAVDPDCVPAHLILAEVALERHRGQIALEHTERAVSLLPRSSASWLAHGDALTLLGRRSEAREAYQRAISELRNTQSLVPPPARIQAVKVALASGKLPAPRFAAAERSIELAPRLPVRTAPQRTTYLHPSLPDNYAGY